METGGLVDFFCFKIASKIQMNNHEKPIHFGHGSRLPTFGLTEHSNKNGRYSEVCCAWLNVLHIFFPAGFEAFLLKTTPPVLGKEF